jgi:hypothetical protein
MMAPMMAPMGSMMPGMGTVGSNSLADFFRQQEERRLYDDAAPKQFGV